MLLSVNVQTEVAPGEAIVLDAALEDGDPLDGEADRETPQPIALPPAL